MTTCYNSSIDDMINLDAEYEGVKISDILKEGEEFCVPGITWEQYRKTSRVGATLRLNRKKRHAIWGWLKAYRLAKMVNIPNIDSDIDIDKTKTICPKCNGTGTIDHYRHVSNGDCFRCNGTGYI